MNYLTNQWFKEVKKEKDVNISALDSSEDEVETSLINNEVMPGQH